MISNIFLDSEIALVVNMTSTVSDKVYTIVSAALEKAYPDLPARSAGMWDVHDLNDKLALVHYTEGSGFERYPSVMRLRGTVVDLEKGVVLVESHGYTHHVDTDDRVEIVDGKLLIKGLYAEGKTLLSFPIEKVRVRPLQEGVMIRVFKFDGKVYASSYKKLNCSKSRFEGGETFLSMFVRVLGGEDTNAKLIEHLFSEDSTKYYVFFVSAKGVKLVSTVTEEHVCLVSVSMTSDLPDLPDIRPQGVVDDVAKMNAILFPTHEIKQDWYKMSDDLAEGEMKFSVDKKGVVTEIESNPYSFAGGDCLLVEEIGGTVWAIRPTGFRKREALAGTKPNFYNNFVQNCRALTLAPSERDAFNFSAYPWPRLEDRELHMESSVDRMIAYCLLLQTVVNPIHRDEISDYVYRLSTDIDVLSEFIRSEKWRKIEPEKSYGKIFKLTAKSAQRMGSLHYEASKTREPILSIRKMLYRETGASLQKLISTVRHFVMTFDDAEMDAFVSSLPQENPGTAHWTSILEKKNEYAKTHTLLKL